MDQAPKQKDAEQRIEGLENRLRQLERSVFELRARIQAIESRTVSDANGEEPLSPGRALSSPSETTAKGRILLMDDDEMIRELTGEKLARLGYRTAMADRGEQAVALYEKALKGGDPFDAVILDLVVQEGMSGKEAIQRLLAIDPGVRAILSSGHMTDPVTSNFWEYGFKAALAKPYPSGALERLLEAVIADACTGP